MGVASGCGVSVARTYEVVAGRVVMSLYDVSEVFPLSLASRNEVSY